MEPGREKAEETAGAGEVHKEEKSAKKNKKGTVTFTVEEAEKMEQLAKELETMKDQYLRLAAEYDNYRKAYPQRKKNRFILMPK